MHTPNEKVQFLGILSDSHDHIPNLTAAIKLLQDRGAQFFIHCGDFCRPEMLDHFVGLPAALVAGNCDDRTTLQRYAAAMNLSFHPDICDLTLGGKRIAFLHGDDSIRMQQLITSQQYDYVLHGHTHIQDDRRFGRTRVINPGALQRARFKTVAFLDLSVDKLETLNVA
jgi:putative phosphoesterase